MLKVVAYVDGFNLYYALRDNGWLQYRWLDLHKLISLYLEKEFNVRRFDLLLKYFTATVLPIGSRKYKRQEKYIEALETNDKVSIHYGVHVPQNVNCKLFQYCTCSNVCGGVWQKFNEKQTDVNIAIEMFSDTVDGISTILFISGDTDLIPVINKINSKFPTHSVLGLFPSRKVKCNELKQMCSNYQTIDLKYLSKSKFPTVIKLPSNKRICCPREWQ